MSELDASFAEPAYVVKLALKHAPFNDGVDSKVYFNGGQLENRLNLLLHLARSSDKNGIVVAGEGVGKTTLLTELRARAGDELKICSISSLRHTDSQSALRQCLSDLGVEQTVSANSSNLVELFQTRLRQLRKLHLTPLLLIDDGQSLSAQLFEEISGWLNWKENDQFLLQAIFASSKRLTLADSILARTQIIDLPALSKKEMQAYLNERLKKSGYVGDTLFSPLLLTKFYKESAGNPRKLNRIVHQYLLGHKKVSTNVFSSLLSVDFKGLGSIILLALVALLLVNQKAINKLFTPEDSPVSDNEIELVKADDEFKTVIVEPEIIQSNEEASRNELEQLLSQISTQPELPKPNNVKPEIKQSKPPKITQPEKLAFAPSVSLKSEPVLLDETWIHKQVSTHYTFQLMGSWDKQEVYDFIDKYALSGNVAIFKSNRNGRAWYALIYGVYRTKASALAASNKWPAPLNTQPSWLRRFDSVQNQIKNK